MTKPPPVIEHEGWRYRRIGPVGGTGGRPSKRPRVSDTGTEEWLCPCCEEWHEGDLFGVDNNATNGLKSWCKRCCREASAMTRAVRGGELGDWKGDGNA
jgi:hypothetical protein